MNNTQENHSLEDYMRLYDEICGLEEDFDGYIPGVPLSDEEVEKAKFIYLMIETINDVLKRRVESVFNYKGIDEETVQDDIYKEYYGIEVTFINDDEE